jgi:hypothetical protein
MPELPDSEGNNEQILNDIQSLQQMEQKLFLSLETNPSMSTEDQEKIIEKLNELSNMRINLYKTLSGVNSYFESALKSSIGSLQEQVMAIGIVEKELNTSKQNLQLLEQERNNKIRLVEINSYYGDKYTEHAQLMKVVIYTLVPVILLVLLNNSGILPSAIYHMILVFIGVIGSYFFWRRYSSIVMRDNMNYQQYNWFFNPGSAAGVVDSTVKGDPWLSGIDLNTCIGDACCAEGLVYDTISNQCVIQGDTSSSSNQTPGSGTTSGGGGGGGKGKGKQNEITMVPFTESMVSNMLSKTQPGKYKADYDLRQFMPFNA